MCPLIAKRVGATDARTLDSVVIMLVMPPGALANKLSTIVFADDCVTDVTERNYLAEGLLYFIAYT